MSRILRILASIYFLFGLFHPFDLLAQIPFREPDKWHLAFNENFDGTLSDNWVVAHEFDHYGEPQLYTNRSENVFIKHVPEENNNYLVLRTQKEDYLCSSNDTMACKKRNYEYTSGWIETNKSVKIQYGYIEARIKIPKGGGLWPAFWTFIGDCISDQHNVAEIDIFEMNGSKPKKLETNIHMDYKGNQPRFGKVITIPDYSKDFHLYGLKWTKDEICWYFDNMEIRKMPNPGIIDPVKLILNVALFKGDYKNLKLDLPAEFTIDYVNYYTLL